MIYRVNKNNTVQLTRDPTIVSTWYQPKLFRAPLSERSTAQFVPRLPASQHGNIRTLTIYTELRHYSTIQDVYQPPRAIIETPAPPNNSQDNLKSSWTREMRLGWSPDPERRMKMTVIATILLTLPYYWSQRRRERNPEA